MSKPYIERFGKVVAFDANLKDFEEYEYAIVISFNNVDDLVEAFMRREVKFELDPKFTRVKDYTLEEICNGKASS